MNQRLNAIAALVPDGIGLIDVGTDHGYLPVYLAQHDYSGRLIASDLREGPLDSARRHAGLAGLEDRIVFQCCDGLDQCAPDAVDTIVIAGMGGDTICGILDRAEWCMDSRYLLVLQPMTKAEVLRYWLVYNEFAITQEILVEDAGTIYSVFTARFGGNTVLNDAELYTGSFEQIRGQALCPRFLSQQKQRFERIEAGLRQGNDPPGRLSVIRSVLHELEVMINDEDRQ